MKIKWRDREVLAAVERHARSGLLAAGDDAAASVRSALSSTGQGGSPAGHPPHKRTGKLAGAVRAEPTADGVRIGVTDPSQMAKAIRLAQGFAGRDSRGRLRNDPARPFLELDGAEITARVAKGR